MRRQTDRQTNPLRQKVIKEIDYKLHKGYSNLL